MNHENSEDEDLSRLDREITDDTFDDSTPSELNTFIRLTSVIFFFILFIVDKMAVLIEPPIDDIWYGILVAIILRGENAVNFIYRFKKQ